jgi:hypothetical protein
LVLGKFFPLVFDSKPSTLCFGLRHPYVLEGSDWSVSHFFFASLGHRLTGCGLYWTFVRTAKLFSAGGKISNIFFPLTTRVSQLMKYELYELRSHIRAEIVSYRR